MKNKRDDLLLNTLRERYVDANVQQAKKKRDAFFDANPKKFTSPLTSEIIEILSTQSESLAQQLKQRIAAGEAAKPLGTRQHTIRHGASHHDGHLTVSIYTKAYYKDIFDAVQQAEIGQLVGPMPVPRRIFNI